MVFCFIVMDFLCSFLGGIILTGKISPEFSKYKDNFECQVCKFNIGLSGFNDVLCIMKYQQLVEKMVLCFNVVDFLCYFWITSF